MAIDDMSAAHIAGQNGFFEPQRQNNALLRIDGLLDPDLLTLSLESFPIPKTALTPIELNYLNERRKVAGPANVEDLEVVVKDWCDVNTRLVLTDWWLNTYDPVTGRIGLAKNYKKRGTVTLYGPNGAFDREYLCYGLWISNYDPGDVDMTAEDKMIMNFTITIDKVIPGKGVSSNPKAETIANTGSYTNTLPQLPQVF